MRVRAGRARLTACVLLGVLGGCAHPRAGTTDVPVRVMTYNIQSGGGSLERTVDAIRASAPDIVALQEVDVHWAPRSDFADQAALLGEKLKMHVRFARIYQLAAERAADPDREFGVALLSKYPIVAWTNRVMTRLSTQEKNPVPAPTPGLLEATVDIAGTMIRVFDTHLDYRSDPGLRRQQIADMLAYIGSTSSPVLLMGDLNAEPNAPELQPLFARLSDAWPERAGSGPTYPAGDPKKRIDYVLVSRHFRVRSASVPVTLASDHRPVVVELRLAR